MGIHYKPWKVDYFRLYACLWRKEENEQVYCTKSRRRGNVLLLILSITLSIAAGTPLPIIGIIFGKIINGFPPSEPELLQRLYQLMGVAVAYFFVTWAWSCCWALIGERISLLYRRNLIHKALGMDLTYYETQNPDISHLITADTQAIQIGTSEKIGLFVQSMSYFLTAFVVGFVIEPKLTGILFCTIIPTMIIVITVGSKTIAKNNNMASTESSKAINFFTCAIRAIQVLKALGCSERISKIHDSHVAITAHYGTHKAITSAFMLGSVFLITYCANALAFYLGAHIIADRSQDNNKGAGTVYTVVFLVIDSSFILGQFGPFLQIFSLASSAGNKIREVLDYPEPSINERRAGQRDFSTIEATDISLDRIHFAYPKQPDVPVLEDVTLEFVSGSFNAIIGMSGSGKSTIASLLMRFYDPTKGHISCGSTKFVDLDVKDYRRHISLVDQKACLFEGSIMENIKQGLPQTFRTDDEEATRRCIEAAEEANALTFIEALPNGFQTMVGASNASHLSGGQEARIALARALVSKPKILILDEPTASLDAISERLIIQSLFKTQKQYRRTTIYITHRLGSIEQSDKIVVLGNGKVMEQGNFEELIKKKTHFFDLISAQSSPETGLVAKAPTEDVSIESDSDGAKSGEYLSEDLATVEEPASRTMKQISLITLFSRILRLSSSDWPLFVIGILASILTGGLVIGESFIFGHLITVLNMEAKDKMKSDANFYCLMFFVLSLIALVAYSISGTSFGIINERLVQRIRNKSLATIMKQDISWFEKPENSPSSLVASCQDTASSIGGLSGVFIGTILSVATSVVGGLIAALIISWKVAIVILAAVPVMILAGFIRFKILAKSQERQEKVYVEAASYASESCHEIRTVASLGLEERIINRFNKLLDKPHRSNVQFIMFGNMWLAFAFSITYFVYSLAYWWGSKQVRNGTCTTQEFFIILPLLLFSAQASGQMFNLAPEVTKAKSAARTIFALHDQKPTIEDDTLSEAEPCLFTKGYDPSTSTGSIELRDVYFAYPSRPEIHVLSGLRLTIKQNEFVAIVGESGAGKSSIISLIERFYDPGSGTILMNDQNIGTNSVNKHRKRLGLVPQVPDIFPGSIYFNISLGAIDSDQVPNAKVEAVCQETGLHEFIMSLPDGYNTECGRQNTQLSGGQLQRLAVARALIRDPEVLLLDEPTSALDSHNEAIVMDAIKKVSRQRTTIMVSHRLATIQDADCIYVMSKGNIVETGTHDELMNKEGLYSVMYQQQSCT